MAAAGPSASRAGGSPRFSSGSATSIAQLRADPHAFFLGATAIQQAYRHRFPRSPVPPLRTLGRILRQLGRSAPRQRGRHGILAHFSTPSHTGVLEGINNKIKVIKQMAYHFRHDAYFFLKIQPAFPGNP